VAFKDIAQMRALAPELTLVIFIVDHRVAFLALAALLVAAVIPLAFAWARILPEDRPPFEIEPPSYPSVELEPLPERSPNSNRDWVASLLLVGVTTGYIFEFPGFPRDTFLRWLNSIFSTSATAWIVFGANTLLIVSAGGAIGYAILNPGPLRLPFATAAALVLILWLLAPLLQVALLGAQ
jgi:hypothetical protein